MEGYTIVCGDSHVLNCTCPLSFRDENGKEYLSAEHFVQHHLLNRFGMIADAEEVLDCRTAHGATRLAWRCVRDKFEGDNIDHLKHLCDELKESFLLRAYSYLFDQCAAFRSALLGTGDSVIVLCGDAADKEFGVGMSPESFTLTVKVHGIKPATLLNAMNDRAAADKMEIGTNKLGAVLMKVRRTKCTAEKDEATTSGAIEMFRQVGLVSEDWRTSDMVQSRPVRSSRRHQGPRNMTDLSTWQSEGIAHIEDDEKFDDRPSPARRPQTGTPGRHMPRSSQFSEQRERGPLLESPQKEMPEKRPGVPTLHHVPTQARDPEAERRKQPVSMRLGYDVSKEIIVLDGVHRYLSNFHPTSITVKDQTYLSVEHYVYYHFLLNLNLPTQAGYVKNEVSDPRKIYEIVFSFACKISVVDPELFRPAKQAFDRGYYIAMRAKFEQNPILQTILLSTGDALLVETDCPENPDYSAGVAVSELQRLVFQQHLRTEDIVRNFIDPTTRPPECEHWGLNKTGMLLMDLRQAIRQNFPGQLPEPFTRIPRAVSETQIATEQITCFSPNSLLGPQFLCSFRIRTNVYLTIEQYMCVAGLRFLRFPKSAETFILSEPVDQCVINFLKLVESQPPPVTRLWDWHRSERFEAIKSAYRHMFEQAIPALKALLTTRNQLMVYCKPFANVEDVELSIGLDEAQFGEFISERNFVATDIMKWSVHRKSRPSLIGGNRMGLLLMELRKDFYDSGYRANMNSVYHMKTPDRSGHGFQVYDDDAEMTSAQAKRRRLEKATEAVKGMRGSRKKKQADENDEFTINHLPSECERMSLIELKSYAGRLIDFVQCLERITSIQDEKRDAVKKELNFVINTGRIPVGYKKPTFESDAQPEEGEVSLDTDAPTTSQSQGQNVSGEIRISPAPEDPP